MIWFLWVIWILSAFVFLYLGFQKEVFLFKLLGGILLIFVGIIVFYEGISYPIGYNESVIYTNSSLFNLSGVQTYDSLTKEENLGLGLAFAFFIIGFAVCIQSVLDYRKKKKGNKGSLEFGEERD